MLDRPAPCILVLALSLDEADRAALIAVLESL